LVFVIYKVKIKFLHLIEKQIYEFFIKCIEKLWFFCLYEFIFEFLNAKRDAAHAASLF